MTDAPPFSRRVRVDALPAGGLTQTIEASPEELAALAALNRLPAIASLTASFTVRRSGRGGARATGEVHAEVTQVCVVSLEPFAATVDEPIDVRFAPDEAAEAARRVKEDDAEMVEVGGEDLPIRSSTARSISARWRPSSLRSASILIRESPASHSTGQSPTAVWIRRSPCSPSRRRNADARPSASLGSAQ